MVVSAALLIKCEPTFFVKFIFKEKMTIKLMLKTKVD